MTCKLTDGSPRPLWQGAGGVGEPGVGSESLRTRGEGGGLGQWKQAEIWDLEFSLEIRAKGNKNSEAQRSKDLDGDLNSQRVAEDREPQVTITKGRKAVCV